MAKAVTGNWYKLKISDIKELIELKKYIISKKDLAQGLGLTENGLAYTLTNETLKLNAFQEICEYIDVDPAELFKKGVGFFIKKERSGEGRRNGAKKSKYTEIQSVKEEIRQIKKVNQKLISTVIVLENRMKNHGGEDAKEGQKKQP